MKFKFVCFICLFAKIFEDLAFLVDVCKKKMNFHHLFAILLFGHNLTSDIFFNTTTPLCQKTGTMFDF